MKPPSSIDVLKAAAYLGIFLCGALFAGAIITAVFAALERFGL